MKPTPYEDINQLLDELLKNVQEIFGEKLVGLYLYGSLVWGDFDHNISDIDLLAALTFDVTEEDVQRLKKMHADFANLHKKWADRIEVQYLSLHALKTFKSEESLVACISPGEPFHTKMIGRHWLMNWYMVQEKGITLFGPSPSTIIDPISKEDFIQSVKEHAANWTEWVKDMKNKKAQAYAILTLCRAFYAYKNGEQTSKKQAANWVMKELPECSDLIQNALSWREKQRSKNEDGKSTYPETEKFVNFIVEKIK